MSCRVLVLSAVALASCAKRPPVTIPENVTPDVRLERVEVEDLTFREADLDLVFTIGNPSPVPVQLDRITWDMTVADTPFLSGSEREAVGIAPRSSSAVRLPVTVPFADVLRVADVARGQDEVPYVVAGALVFDTPIGDVQVPFRHAGELPVLVAPTISLSGIRVTAFDLRSQQVQLLVDVDVHHEMGRSIGISTLDYDFMVDEVPVASGKVTDIDALAPGETRRLTLPVGIDLARLGEQAASGGDLELDLLARATVETPWGTLPLIVTDEGTIQLREARR